MSKVLKLMRLTSYSHPKLDKGPLNRGDTIKVDDAFGEELLAKGPEGEEGETDNTKKYFIELPALAEARYDYTVDEENAKKPPLTRTQRSLAQNVPNDKTVTNVQGQVIPSLLEEETRGSVGEQDAGTLASLQVDPATTHHPQAQPTTDAMGNDISGNGGEEGGESGEGGEEGEHRAAARPLVKSQRTARK